MATCPNNVCIKYNVNEYIVYRCTVQKVISKARPTRVRNSADRPKLYERRCAQTHILLNKQHVWGG